MVNIPIVCGSWSKDNSRFQDLSREIFAILFELTTTFTLYTFICIRYVSYVEKYILNIAFNLNYYFLKIKIYNY